MGETTTTSSWENRFDVRVRAGLGIREEEDSNGVLENQEHLSVGAELGLLRLKKPSLVERPITFLEREEYLGGLIKTDKWHTYQPSILTRLWRFSIVDFSRTGTVDRIGSRVGVGSAIFDPKGEEMEGKVEVTANPHWNIDEERFEVGLGLADSLKLSRSTSMTLGVDIWDVRRWAGLAVFIGLEQAF